MADPLLLVEDHDFARNPIIRFLTDVGYEVDACATYNDALDRLVPAHGEPVIYAAILTDFNLGDRFRTGLHICQAASRSVNRTTPIIATSSEMKYWEPAKDVFKLHLIPKTSYSWDGPAILAKLQELDIRP